MNMEEFEKDNTESLENTIVELNTETEEKVESTSTLDTVKEISDTEIMVTPGKKKKSKKPKKERKFNWHDLSKPKKIMIIVIPAVILLIILGLLLYFLVFKKDDEESKPKEPEVVLEKENYIYENGTLKLLDDKDKTLGTYECKDKDTEKCYVATLSTEDEFDVPTYVDSKGKKLVRTSKIYNDNYVFIFDDGKITLYNIDEESTSGSYELIKTGSIEESLVVAKNDEGKYGIISFENDEAENLLDFEYEFLGIIEDAEKFVASDGDYSYLVDTSGESVTAKIKGMIRKFNEKYLSVYEDENYFLYDYKGVNQTEEENDFIDFASSYIFVIRDGRMYGYDDEMYKLNEVGFRIKSDDYVTTYVFDKDNNLEETKKAYSISTTTGNVEITYDDGKVKTININEAKLNKSLKYINYYDGILYFYTDLEKTDLIGSYSCTNDNNVKSSDTTLSNCMLAKNTNILSTDAEGTYTPIMNNQYAFIYDTASGSTTSTIVLYDLKNSSQKAKYTSVDTLTKHTEITHDTAFAGDIACLNTKGKYGIIAIKDSGPVGVLDPNFEAKKLSYFKADYLLVENDSENVLYATNDLKTPLGSSKYTIVDYAFKHLIVKDSKYLVYNSDGKVVKKDLDHVELRENFFIGIAGNKLNIYKYDSADTGILAEDVALETSDSKYENYKVTVDSGYKVEVLNTDDTWTTYEFDNKGEKIANEEE